MFTVLTHNNYTKLTSLPKKQRFKFLKEIKESKFNLMNNPEAHLEHLGEKKPVLFN
jgi:mRNA-degrading endonuclease RelE of RelBE toxin-antitoxin system